MMLSPFRKSLTAYITLLILVLALQFNSTTGAQGKRKRKTNAEVPVPAILEALPTSTPIPPANGALFSEGAVGSSLVTDFKPRRVGDLVFIAVDESSTATVSSSANRSRDSGTIGGLVSLIAAIPSPSAVLASNVAGAMGQRKFDGKGATQRTSTLKARIAARVVEVLPNGDLRIQADKFVKINKEDEQFTLSGIVRQRDVSADNVIATSFVGDLKIALNGKGVASADNAPGWLFRLLDKIGPF